MSGRIKRFEPKTMYEFKKASYEYSDNKEEAIKKYGIMKDWDVGFIKDLNTVSRFSGKRYQPKTMDELKKTAQAYVDNKEETIKRYGFMHDWDVSLIKDIPEGVKAIFNYREYF